LPLRNIGATLRFKKHALKVYDQLANKDAPREVTNGLFQLAFVIIIF